jgi:hypothetical protein
VDSRRKGLSKAVVGAHRGEYRGVNVSVRDLAKGGYFIDSRRGVVTGCFLHSVKIEAQSERSG